MFTALFGTLANAVLGGASSAASTAASACQASLSTALRDVNSLRLQRNAALGLIPMAFAFGLVLGRKLS